MVKHVVRYAVKYEEFTVTEAEYNVVAELYRQTQKVVAIKFLRQQYGLGLKEAKDICDGIATASGVSPTYIGNYSYETT